jgi:hypothetical protein
MAKTAAWQRKEGKNKERYNSYIIRQANSVEPAFCPKCTLDKPVTEFYRHSTRGDGFIRYRPYCKKCRKNRPRSAKSRPVHSLLIEKGVQKCMNCKEDKTLDNFYSNGCFSDGVKKYRTRCKVCVLENLAINNNKIYKTKCEKRSSSYKNFITGILNHAAKRKQDLGFNIDIGFLINLYESQEGKCAISGEEMTYLAGGGRKCTNISIDRIDSNKGYVRDNVQFVCDVVNVMKQQLTKDELILWCNKIIKNSKNDEI